MDNNFVLCHYPIRSISDLITPIKNNFDKNTAIMILSILRNFIMIEDLTNYFSISMYLTTVEKFFNDVGEIKKHNANISIIFEIDKANNIYMKVAGSTQNNMIYIAILK